MVKFNSLYKIFIGLVFFSSTFLLAAEISIDVNLIKTGQYNVSDFLDPSVNLWTVNIHCTDCTQGDSVFYLIEVRLNFNEIDPAVWGVTYLRNVSYESPNDILTNFDFQDGDGLLNEYNQDDDFIALLEENYYLPAGDVTLNVKAFLCEPGPLAFIPNIFMPEYHEYTCGNVDVNVFDSSVSGTILASDQESIQNNVVSELNLISPAINSDVSDPYPWLRWESPGFVNGVRIDYKLYVYLFDPRFHSSYSDAIEDNNFLYFTKDISQYETGIPQQIQVQYPSDDRDLACGYQYVWYIEARDIIQDSPFNGESGIWGWPIPIKSPLYVFNYGSIINANKVVSPSIGSEISTVLPSFSVDPVDCADSYEIWLSDSEDSDVENPIWISGALQTNVNVYPTDAIGLLPGSDYKWKIRVNPDGEPLPWSDIFDFRVMGYTLDDPVLGQVLNTVSPTFSFTGPSDIAGFELQISNIDDPMVESGNIFNEYIQSFPFNLPTDIPVGLLPGETYFWKVLFLDGNDNIVGEIDDYTTIESFSIEGIELNSPSHGASDLSLTPSFTWDGPIGVAQYEYSLSKDDDPSIENPIITINVPSTFYQYPQYGDFPLEYSQLYYWKIVPLDINDNRGASSEYYSFSTSSNITNVVIDEINYTKPEFSLSNGQGSSPKDIIVNLLVGVSGAEEYIILFSDNQEMGSMLGELSLEANQTEAILDGEDLDWGLTVYAQVFAIVDGEIFGEESSIQIINLPEKPGSDQQVGISVSLEGSKQLVIEITNGITNTVEYILEIATDDEMTEIYYSDTAFESIPTVYPESADPLMYGETYFVQVYANDDEGLHGLPSSVISIFIPNIVPPILTDKFSWDATVPASNSYTIQISTTDDFSSIVVEELIYGTSFILPVKTLDPGTGYYWRVHGFDSDDNPFGNASSIGYFATDPIPIPILNPLSEVTSLLPEFTWTGIEQANSYLIDVSSDINMETILWSDIRTSTNAIYDETAFLLEYANSYYCRISTISDDGEILSVSDIESFSTTSIFPVLGLSPNGGTETYTPTLGWELNNNYSSYKIIISEDTEFRTIIFNSIVETNNILVNEEGLLQSGITYYWKVEGLDSNGESPAGPSESAILVMPSLKEIPIISPREDEQVSNLIPQLKWGSLENTSSYTLKVATDAGLESIIIDETVSGTEYQIPEDKILINKMTYYWQIEVVTETERIKSELSKFSTPSIDEIGILSLDDGAEISITNPIFSWEGIQGVAAYNIQFSTNPDLSESWTKLSGSSNFEYPSEPPLEINTSYYWRVCALSNEGEQVGLWTTARTFTISQLFIIQLELPPSGEAVTTRKPIFSWGAIEGASKYEIRISANEDYSQIMWQSSNVAQNSVQYPSSEAETLLVETVFYWSVRAIAEDIALGDFSASFTFTVSEDNKPVLTGPMNGIAESILPFFTWNKIPKANSYGLVIGINEDVSQVIFENHNISDKHFQYTKDAPPLKYNTAYYWKVIAYDENGSPLGDYSSIATFTTPTGIIQIEFIYENIDE